MVHTDTLPRFPLARAEHDCTPAAGAAPAWWQRMQLRFAEWRVNARSRRELAGLDEHLLHDIGLSPNQAAFEIDKPFWRR